MSLALEVSVATLRVMQFTWSKVRVKLFLRCKCFGAQKLFARKPDSFWSWNESYKLPTKQVAIAYKMFVPN